MADVVTRRRKDSAHIVYILDDDVLMRASIARILVGVGYEPHAFSELAPMLDRVTQTVPEVYYSRSCTRQN
jgi:FixJ family two-component response regulator